MNNPVDKPKKRRKPRRGNNEGSIYRRKDGRWVGAITFGYTQEGKARRRVVYGKTKTEAQNKMSELMNEHRMGRNIEINRITVGEHFDDWWREKKLHVRPNTWHRDESHARIHIKPFLGQIELRKLTHRDIIAFYEHLQEDTALSQRTIFDVSSALRAGLRDAV